jgi:hypothetical protein
MVDVGGVGVGVGVVVLLVVSRRCGIVSEGGMQRVMVSSVPASRWAASGGSCDLDACAAAAGGAKWTSSSQRSRGRIGLSDVVRRQRFLQRAVSFWALRSWRRCRSKERAQIACLCLEQIHRAVRSRGRAPGQRHVTRCNGLGRSVRRCPAGAVLPETTDLATFVPCSCRPLTATPPPSKEQTRQLKRLFHSGRPRVERHVIDRGFRRPWVVPSKRAPARRGLAARASPSLDCHCILHNAHFGSRSSGCAGTGSATGPRIEFPWSRLCARLQILVIHYRTSLSKPPPRFSSPSQARHDAPHLGTPAAL